MGTSSYWAKRSVEREAEWSKKSRETIEKELIAQYERSAQNIKADIERLYGKFSMENGISISEARKLIDSKEFYIWRKDMQDYIAEYQATGNPKLLLEMNTLAMRSRISRLDKLYGDTLRELDKLGQASDKTITGFLKESYKDSRLKNAYDLAKKGQGPLSVAVDNKHIESVLRNPWSGKNYSQRIWKNSENLAKTIQDTIVNGVHRGVSVNKMAKEVQERMDMAKHDAVRLVRTEMNYVLNQGALDAIKDAKMKYYKFIATLDKRTSTVCREHDGKIYNVADAETGTNVPPLHPHCRSTIAASLKGSPSTKGSRIAKNENGTYQRVPRNMNYNDWKAVYVDKTKTLDDWKAERKRNKPNPNTEVVVRKPQDLIQVEIGTPRVQEAIRFFDKPSYNDVQRMGKNLMPLSDTFIEMVLLRNLNDRALKKHIEREKALEDFNPFAYTKGKKGIERWYTDADFNGNKRELYPPNNGAIGEPWDEVLPVGTKLSRYGEPTGKYLAPVNTPFENRAMPNNDEYYNDDKHTYVVEKPLQVHTSVIAPAFEQVGGGIQYNTDKSIQHYLDEGYIKEVD